MKLAQHFMVSECDGALYDTRLANWSSTPVRENYSRTHRKIHTTQDLKATLRAGQFTFPGCYQLFLLANDGEPICFDCATKNFHQCAWSIRNKVNDGWRIVACDVNWEDEEMRCAHCNKQIPASYGA